MAQAPPQQDMGGTGNSELQKLREDIQAKFPSFSKIAEPQMRRTACICSHCTCCYRPVDEHGEPLFCSSGRIVKCLCCTCASTSGCCKCKPEWKVWSLCQIANSCCDLRGAHFELCSCVCQNIAYCCTQGANACFCNFKDITCLKDRLFCCCLYSACALPCDADVPLELGVCGIMIINKAGGSEPAK